MKLNCNVVDDSAIQRITITKLVNESTLLNLIEILLMPFEAKIVLTTIRLILFF